MTHSMYAQWWRPAANQMTQCELCPRECVIAPDKTGFCHTRRNYRGQLVSLVYGRPAALHIDPIEKKPLYHFLPGSQIFSIGTIGCNLDCRFCQNWELARAELVTGRDGIITAAEILNKVQRSGCPGIAFTYNEPTVFAEYVLDISRLARQEGFKTVMVTNGYITEKAIRDIYPLIDAANIDLKAISADFYQKYCHADLASVLNAIRLIREQGTWIELTTLIIPGLNDQPTQLRELAGWIIDNLGCETVWHLSAFHPAYRMLAAPATSKATLDLARQIAIDAGLHYVYEGNVMTGDESDTFCPDCGNLLIRRSFYRLENYLEPGGYCRCGAKIPIVL